MVTIYWVRQQVTVFNPKSLCRQLNCVYTLAHENIRISSREHKLGVLQMKMWLLYLSIDICTYLALPVQGFSDHRKDMTGFWQSDQVSWSFRTVFRQQFREATPFSLSTKRNTPDEQLFSNCADFQKRLDLRLRGATLYRVNFKLSPLVGASLYQENSKVLQPLSKCSLRNTQELSLVSFLR